MKDQRIVATDSPVTCVTIDGRPHHYFHSEKLGKCRALLISEDVNLSHAAKPYATKPLSKGEKLEMLMDCGERLHERFILAFDALRTLPDCDHKGRDKALAKVQRIQKANRRVNRKITLLLEVGV
jgi:hypothetical protein